MDSVKILHCADIHIGANASFLGSLSATRRYETLITFEKIISTAKENNVDLLLIAGDLLDSNNIESSFTDRVFEGLNSIPDTQIVFCAGNHDPLNINSPFLKYKLPENLHILKTKDDCIFLENLNTRVYGRSFGEVYMEGEREFSIKPENDGVINIMCQHGELKSDLNSNYNAITPDFVKGCGMDYIALGHVHKRSEVGKMGSTCFAYSGCVEGQGFDELGEKGVYMGTVSKEGCNIEFIPLCKRMHICENIDIGKLVSNIEVLQKITLTLKEKYGEKYTENLYKIILVGECDESFQISIPEILSRFSGDVYFAKIKDKTTPKTDLEKLSREKTLKGVFVRKMLEKIDGAPSDEKPKLEYALTLGLKAFSKEVSLDEN